MNRPSDAAGAATSPLVRRAGLLALLALAALIPAAAQNAYPVRYELRTGDVLVYETTTRAEGQIALTTPTGPRGMPLSLQIVDRTRYEVLSIEQSGEARIEQRLDALAVVAPGAGAQLMLALSRTPEGVRVQQGTRDVVVPLPAAGEEPGPLPEELGTLGGIDPRRLMEPRRFRMMPNGQVTAVSGPSWAELLVDVPLVGALAPLFQPFGAALPEVPGKALSMGDEWEQARAMALPGAPGDAYPMDVLFALEEPMTVGERPAVRIGFDGTADASGREFQFALGEARVPMQLDSLHHELHGHLVFAPETGRLLEQHLESSVLSDSHGTLNGQAFSIDAEVNVTADSLLLESSGQPAI